MRTVRKISTLKWHFCLLAILIVQTGCSRSTTSGATMARQTAPTLSPVRAAQLAAKLANDKCERLHQRRPFTPAQHPAVRVGDRYRWCGLAAGAAAGMSVVAIPSSETTYPDS